MARRYLLYINMN